MICCIAAAFVFGLLVRTVQTVLRRRDRGSVHPTPVRRVPEAPVDHEVTPGDDRSGATIERVPVGTGA